MDLNFLIFVFPAGVILCFKELRDEHVFVIIYAVMASYFAGVMVRLMLTLTPVVCVAAAIALSTLLDTYVDPTEPSEPATIGSASGASTPASAAGPGAIPIPAPSKKAKKAAAAASLAPPPSTPPTHTASTPSHHSTPAKTGIFGLDTRIGVILNTILLLSMFVNHCTYVTSTAYSSPSVVLASKNPDGSQHIIDDFREAYYWLRQNTKEDAVIMSWWDYGYQIAGMADRATLVDNNTWNNSEFLVCVPRPRDH
jgi:dolichyl-diphosphooligosaccharide--protein glycosyltransferase